MGTFVVSLILVAVVGLIIYKMIKDKKSGKSLTCGCGCSCENCSGNCSASGKKA